jgi:hypothetical protein
LSGALDASCKGSGLTVGKVKRGWMALESCSQPYICQARWVVCRSVVLWLGNQSQLHLK